MPGGNAPCPGTPLRVTGAGRRAQLRAAPLGAAQNRPFDTPLAVQADRFGRRPARQPGHGHDVPADRDHEAGPGREPDIAHRQDVAVRCPAPRRVGAEAVLGLGHANAEPSEPGLLEAPEPRGDRRRQGNIVGAVDLARDRAELVGERHLRRIERPEARLVGIEHPLDRFGERRGAGRAIGPVRAGNRLGAERRERIADQRGLRLGVAGEAVQRHHDGQAEFPHVLHMPKQVRQPRAERREVLPRELRLGRRRHAS